MWKEPLKLEDYFIYGKNKCLIFHSAELTYLRPNFNRLEYHEMNLISQYPKLESF